jgi:hypothetical protein
MFTVPEDQLINRRTIFNQMGAISLRGGARVGALIGGGYGAFVALGLAGPAPALVGGIAGGVLGCTLGALLGLVNGLVCVIATIVGARPLRSPQEHQRAMYGISTLNFGIFTLLGLNDLFSGRDFLVFAGIPAILAALAGLWVGHELADWYVRRIRAEQRERQRMRQPYVMLDAQQASSRSAAASSSAIEEGENITHAGGIRSPHG